MAKSIKSTNRQGRPKSDEDDKEDDDDDDDYKSMKDDDSDNDDNEDNNDDNNDDDDDDNDNDDDDVDDNNNVSEFAIGKGSNAKRIKEKIGGEYNDDKNFVHTREWEKKYNELRDLCQEYKRDNILLRAELRAAKGSRETTKRKMREILGAGMGKKPIWLKMWDIIEERICFHATNFLRTNGMCLTQISRIACRILLGKDLKFRRVQIIMIYGRE
jgi:hypothetical protein